jgi:hypothetical protein
MSKGIFDPAISELPDKPVGFWGPESFQNYLDKNKIRDKKTAAHISVDSLQKLDKSLRKNDIMVLRLGKSKDRRSTQFGLAKVSGKLNDFFIIDKDIFNRVTSRVFQPKTSKQALYPFVLFPSTSETGFVNYAFASGIIKYALHLDSDQETIMPLTWKRNYTFELKPHTRLKPVTHRNGQVEIDSLFVGKRKNKYSLFIIEAKSDKTSSLAKHKLVYPILSILSKTKKIPVDMAIIPIYMRIIEETDVLHFLIAECNYPNPRIRLEGIDKLKVVNSTHLIVPKPSSKTLEQYS